jgi:hypothetical protein
MCTSTKGAPFDTERKQSNARISTRSLQKEQYSLICRFKMEGRYINLSDEEPRKPQSQE